VSRIRNQNCPCQRQEDEDTAAYMSNKKKEVGSERMNVGRGRNNRDVENRSRGKSGTKRDLYV
jgi:hypothetical protein